MALKIFIEVNIDSHPKHVAAGFWGSLVAQTCWRLSKEANSDGDVTRFFNAAYLARRMLAGESMLPDIEFGMKAALTAGLLEQDGERIFIHDYERYQNRPDGTAAQRQARFRANKKVTDNNADVTPLRNDVTPLRNKKVTATIINNNNAFSLEGESEGEGFSPVALALAGGLRDAILTAKPDHKTISDSDVARWSQQIGLMMRLDGRTKERIEAVLAWLPTDDFWPPNIQSGKKLREKFDQLEDKMRQPTKGRGRNKEGEVFMPPSTMTEEDIKAISW